MLADFSSLMETKEAAICAVRAFTGRIKILQVHDSEAGDSATIPGVELVSSGKMALLCEAMAESDQRIAAVIVTPARSGNPALKRYLRRLREIVSAEGALLIWVRMLSDDDSVVSPESYNIQADLTIAQCHGHFQIQGRPDVMIDQNRKGSRA